LGIAYVYGDPGREQKGGPIFDVMRGQKKEEKDMAREATAAIEIPYGYRHGDLALIRIEKLPEGLTGDESKTLLTGSHGHPHTYDVGDFYPHVEGNCVIGYFVARGTTLYHPEHGDEIKGSDMRPAVIADGVYELRRQVEQTLAEMKPVID
jgi:hypothetical protein